MNSLFDQDDNDNKDYLAELTGPGGKYDRTKYPSEVEMYQAIAKGKVHGDRLIDLKLKEFDELRDYAFKLKEDNVAKASFEDYMTKFSQVKREDVAPQPLANTEKPPQIDYAKIQELASAQARAAVMELETQKTEAQSLALIESRLRDRYGENAKSIMKEKMNALNLSVEDIKALAKKSPDAVINALGLNYQPQPYSNLPNSNTRSDSFKPQETIRDAIYWEKLRQEKPKEYFLEKNSIQRLKDMDNPDFLKRYQERQRTF